jgi:cell division protein FtsW (lipid II flippase)
VYTVGRVKVNGYWNWTSIKVADAAAAKQIAAQVTSPAATQPRAVAAKPERVGSWETPDERSAKQVYIVRQSSIANAIALVGAGKAEVSQVLKIAKQFEDFVFASGIEGLVSDDLPE